MDKPQAEATNGSQRTGPPQPVEGLLDLNVLPKRYQPSRPSFLTISAWLLFLVLLGLLVPSTTQFQEASSSLAAQRIRLELAQEQLAQDRSSPEELETLRADIEATWRRAEELQVSLASLNIQTVQWGPRLAEAVAAAPAGIRFESVQEDSDLITIVGLAHSYGEPLKYAEHLRGLEQFGTVGLQGITRVEFEQGEGPITDREDESSQEGGASEPNPSPDGQEEPAVAFMFRIQAELVGSSTEISEGEEVTP